MARLGVIPQKEKVIPRSTMKSALVPALPVNPDDIGNSESWIKEEFKLRDDRIAILTADNALMKMEMKTNVSIEMDAYESWVLYTLDPHTITDTRLRDWVIKRLRNKKKNEIYLLRRAESLRKLYVKEMEA